MLAVFGNERVLIASLMRATSSQVVLHAPEVGSLPGLLLP
jgi:hypothetical protein